MKDIIEKLGITPGPWEKNPGDINYIGDPDWFYKICSVSCHRKYPNNLDLIAAAPEMLERDITFFSQLEKIALQYKRDGNKEAMETAIMIYYMYDLTPDLKATKRSWKEMKTILE